MDHMINLTPRAQQVLVLARQEAEKFNNDAVGAEHLLLGIMKLAQGIALNILQAMHVSVDLVREKIEKSLKRKSRSKTEKSGEDGSDTLAIDSTVKNILVLAAQEATMLQHPYIGTEHLLLGIMKEAKNNAAKALTDVGVSLSICRKAVLAALDPSFAGFDNMAPKNEEAEEYEDFEDDDDDDDDKFASKKNLRTPGLKAFGRDLTAMAKDGELDPVIGRDKEIERVIQILCRRSKNNPALIGDAGVGKTAIVEGLAQSIANGTVPEPLLNKRVIALDMALMLAGTKYRGQFEERIKAVMDEINRVRNVILFLDEFHTIVGAGSSEGSMDASNILKPALSRGDIQCIGATTNDEYRKYIEKDSALERRFQMVKVDPPSIEESIQILHGIKKNYESHHNVTYTDEAISESVRLADRYIADRFLPDKAIDVLDEAGARMRLKNAPAPPKIDKINVKIEKAKESKDKAIADQNFENAAKFRDIEKKLTTEKDEILEAWKKDKQSKKSVVDVNVVYDVISTCTGVPMRRLEQNEAERLLYLADELKQKVIGQDCAAEAVSNAIRRARADLQDPNRPIGSFMFLGPTGVGKTHLAKMLAEQIFDNKDALIQIDMSEYMEKHSVSRMIGSPPGYVGHDEGGKLTEIVRRKPYSIILFDEIEKAHPDVVQILLQVLEDGHLTDSLGRRVDFKNTILIMTTNVGADILQKDVSLGFGKNSASDDFDKLKERIIDEAKKAFKPEFLNRLTEMVVFRQLSKEDLKKVVLLETEKVSKRVSKKGITIHFSDEACEFLIKNGYDSKLGARPLKRAIEKFVENPMSDYVLNGKFVDGDKVEIYVDEDKKLLTFNKKSRPRSCKKNTNEE